MQTQDLERIRFVTRHYGELQGLAWLVPAGGLLLAMGLGMVPDGALLSIFVLVLLFSLTFVASFVAKSYYRRTFGEVERQPSHLRTLLIFLFFVGIELFRSLGAARRTYLLFGSLLLGLWVSQRLWSQVHYLVLGVLLLGLAAPGPSSVFFLPALVRGGVPEILSGTALILAGLLNHRQLVKVLGPSAAALHEMEEAEPMKVKR